MKKHLFILIILMIIINFPTFSQPPQLYYAPRFCLENFIKNDSELLKFFKENINRYGYLDFFVWDGLSGEIIIPNIRACFNRTQLDKLKELYNNCRGSEVLLSSFEMNLFLLKKLQNYQYYVYEKFQSLEFNGINNSDILAYMFITNEGTTDVRAVVNHRWQSSERRIIWEDMPENLQESMNNVYHIQDIEINILAQAFLYGLSLDNYDYIEASNGYNIDVVGHIPPFPQVRKLKEIGNDDNKIYFFDCKTVSFISYRNSIKSIFHTNLLKDIVTRSTIIRNGNPGADSNSAFFVLSYIKTNNFEEGDITVNDNIREELHQGLNSFANYFQNCANQRRFSPINPKLCIDIVGFADTTGLGSLGENEWRRRNQELATNRARVVGKILSNFLRESDFEYFRNIENINTRACKDTFFYANDRSVEIKLWLR